MLSSASSRPPRTHCPDSGTPEGLVLYDEEMLLQAGLLDDSPHSDDVVHDMMRLRALRVEVNVKLALGRFTDTLQRRRRAVRAAGRPDRPPAGE